MGVLNNVIEILKLKKETKLLNDDVQHLSDDVLKLESIGDIISSSDLHSVTTSTALAEVEIGTITLDKGVYLIDASCRSSFGGTQYYTYLTLYKDTTRVIESNAIAYNGQSANPNIAIIVKCTSSTTFSLRTKCSLQNITVNALRYNATLIKEMEE